MNKSLIAIAAMEQKKVLNKRWVEWAAKGRCSRHNHRWVRDTGEEVLLYLCLGRVGGGEVLLQTRVVLASASCKIISVSTKTRGN
jgi:hypothetical protein